MHQNHSSRTNALTRQDIPSGGKNAPAVSENLSLAAGDARLNEAVSQLNDYIQSIHRNIEFTVDAKVNRVVVKVYNLDTGEILREIPAEEVLNMPNHIVKQMGWLSDLGL